MCLRGRCMEARTQLEKAILFCELAADDALDENIEKLRSAQNVWRNRDPQACRAFFKHLCHRYPKSARHLYLYGRLVRNSKKRLYLARQGITLAPDWPYSYRLLMGAYCTCLYRNKCSREDRQALKDEIHKDARYFEQVYENCPDAGNMLSFVFDYNVYNKRYDGAKAVLKKARKLKQGWAQDSDPMIVVKAAQHNEKAVRKYVTGLVKQMEREGQLDTAERPRVVTDWMTRYYQAAFEYEEALRLLEERLPEASSEETAWLYFDMARYATLMEKDELAFRYLGMALNRNFDRVDRLQQEEDFTALHSDPRWAEYVEGFRQNWMMGKTDRRQAALFKKVALVAPEFAMRDEEGNRITLEDLKGHVTVLDFWATMCGPCQKTLPEIDRFYREDREQQVKVYSVNIWDKSREYVVSYVRKRGYVLPVAFGNDQMKRRFEVNSIPQVFVIDHTGIIRYREQGFKIGLRERLRWWTRDLVRAETRAETRDRR